MNRTAKETAQDDAGLAAGEARTVSGTQVRVDAEAQWTHRENLALMACLLRSVLRLAGCATFSSALKNALPVTWIARAAEAFEHAAEEAAVELR